MFITSLFIMTKKEFLETTWTVVLVHFALPNTRDWGRGGGRCPKPPKFISGGWKSEIRVPTWSGATPGEEQLLVHKRLSSLGPHPVEGARGALWGLLRKSTNPIHGGSIYDPITSQRSHLLRPGFQHMIWWGPIQTIANIHQWKTAYVNLQCPPNKMLCSS